VLEEFGPEMQKRFYDEEADNGPAWNKFSITGKLIDLDKKLTEYHNENPDKPQDPNLILQRYSSITQDCYGFYSEVIARIQQGRVGRRSWSETTVKASPNG
jgi:hypothetical protein